MAGIEEEFFREFQRMQARMNAMFSGAAARPTLPGSGAFVPAADLCETETSFLVCVEIAGVKSEDVEILVRGRTVFLSGERKAKAPSGARVHQMEIDFGPFRKAIELPIPIEREEDVKSRYEDGMLILEFAKPPTRKVEVKDGG
ncbi:MAG: Hsp20/alpha crystallin family protein [Planctomycetota bacterium]|jgi:HSP20 family protein